MNQLKNQKSLYLQQHANNPVNWFPWGVEAFETAQKENKVVLVSIGYSTCHWCHVMERESFEDEQVAEVMNENFVCIKVDREEHPDVDQFYMDTLLAIQGHGGWPLNAFVTPEKKTFFAFTYMPPANFVGLMKNIQKEWEKSPEGVLKQADTVFDHVAGASLKSSETWNRYTDQAIGVEAVAQKYSEDLVKLRDILLQNFDPVYGGFTQAPKFPRSHAVSALLRSRKVDAGYTEHCDDAVRDTLKAMAYGGMRDQLGGGFHRYSTDERWFAPHFEKMLYDQALLLRTYSEAALEYGDPFFADICGDLIRDLRENHLNKDASLAAAFDADSENVEGKFFVWELEEIQAILSPLEGVDPKDIEEFAKVYNVAATPNWEEGNILHLSLDQKWEQTQTVKMKKMREALLDARAKRVWPARDGKAIVAWNGQMLSALAQCVWNLSTVSPKVSGEALELLKSCAPFVVKMCEDSRLARVFYEGSGSGEALFEDHVSLLEAMQHLQSLSFAGYELDEFAGALSLEWEKARMEFVLENFWDSKTQSFSNRARASRSRGEEAERADAGVPLNRVSDEDGATPSTLSIFVGVFARYALKSQDEKLQSELTSLVNCFRKTFDKNPLILSYMMSELELLSRGALVKLPEGSGLKRLTKLRLSQLQLMSSPRQSDLEACDWKSCFYKGAPLVSESSWQELLEKIGQRA